MLGGLNVKNNFDVWIKGRGSGFIKVILCLKSQFIYASL